MSFCLGVVCTKHQKDPIDLRPVEGDEGIWNLESVDKRIAFCPMIGALKQKNIGIKITSDRAR